ncbi:putative regulator of G protein signaling [Schistosoma mansoni]|uniref:putative regulator of G protein signaling n=1 Tax=Schistosoma mansoni TaxID=6183 RepID=UPI0001A63DDD|nr:putative regulator of G protein signaling [Schistosoma mansoni]|eukprot:XP_018655437.1 putative regulator of G protein signaling [Schistosoma mansoni]
MIKDDEVLKNGWEFVGQLQRANKYEGTPRESIHESLERLPMFDNESKKSTSSQQYRNEKSDGSSRNSFSPADFISTSPRHSTTIGSIGGKKNKIGFQFFRPKTSVQPGAKLVQVKELKRMIRAGKPSYEQIHNWGHSFEALLNDKYGLALFKDFLSTEFSDENIEFWIACQDYKHTTNPKKLAIKANQIFTEFIAVQANREVNLDSKTRLQTEADLSNPTVNTLENAQKRIQALMEKDSYRRFLRSEVYLTMLKEARETAKAAATAALAASLQEASDELDEPVFQLVHSTTYTSPFSFLSTFSSTFSAQNTPSLTLPGVAAAAAKADAGLNNIQDLQLLGLSTSRHMRENKQNYSIANRSITNTNTSTNLTTTSSIASSPNEIISESIQSNITCCETGYTSTTITTHTTISSHTYSTHNVTDSNDICDITNNVNTYLNTEMSNSTK